MRRLAFGLGLLALSACTHPQPRDAYFPVYFQAFSSSLDDAGMEVVQNAASEARAFPQYRVRVSGYADAVGSPQTVVTLSKARADTVANMLQQDGVEPSRISREAVGTPPNSQPGVERRRVTIFLDAP